MKEYDIINSTFTKGGFLMKPNTNVERFYTVATDKKKEHVDIIEVDAKKKSCKLVTNEAISKVGKIIDTNNPCNATKISRFVFDTITTSLKATSEDANATFIQKKKIISAIDFDLSYEKLIELLATESVQVGDYFEFDSACDGVNRFIKGEITVEFFSDWALIFSRALLDSILPDDDSEKAQLVLEIANTFIEMSQFKSNEKPEKENKKIAKGYLKTFKDYDKRYKSFVVAE